MLKDRHEKKQEYVGKTNTLAPTSGYVGSWKGWSKGNGGWYQPGIPNKDWHCVGVHDLGDGVGCG